jgi:hypothetical protein
MVGDAGGNLGGDHKRPRRQAGHTARRGEGAEVPFAINYGAIPLGPAARYEWRLSVNDHTDEDWTLPFTTRAVTAPDVEAEAA